MLLIGVTAVNRLYGKVNAGTTSISLSNGDSVVPLTQNSALDPLLPKVGE